MKIYFAINNEMIKKWGAPININNPNTYNWLLHKDSCLCGTHTSYGAVLNKLIERYGTGLNRLEEQSAIICRAEVSDSFVISLIQDACNGSFGSPNIETTINLMINVNAKIPEDYITNFP